MQAKKVEKQTRKTTVKNENKFEFSKLSDLKENNVFTFNLPTWKSSKYVFLESKKENFTFNLLTQKKINFNKIWDPVFDLHGTNRHVIPPPPVVEWYNLWPSPYVEGGLLHFYQNIKNPLI